MLKNRRGNLIRTCSEQEMEKTFRKYSEISRQRGSFGPVIHVVSKRMPKPWKPKSYVVKQIQLGRFSGSFQQEIIDEVQAAASLRHPGLVATQQVKLTSKHMYIFTEACNGGNLHSRFPYTEKQAKNIVKQALEALEHIHKKGYIHKGLTYEKVLFRSQNSSKVKVFGFGLSGHHNKPPGQSGQLQTPTSFLRSTAPEVFLGIVSNQCDMWSLGVLVFELLGGEKPFTNPSIISLMKAIAEAKYRFDGDMWQSRAFPAKRFCCELMCKVPESRMSATEALTHYWMTHDDEVDKPSIELPSYKTPTLLSTAPPLEKIIHQIVDRTEFVREQQELSDHFKSLDIRGQGNVTVHTFKSALKKVFGEKYYNESLKDIRLRALNVCYTDFIATAVHQFLLAKEQSLCESLDNLDTTSSRVLPFPFVNEVLATEFSERFAKCILSRLSQSYSGTDKAVSFESVFLALRSEMQKITDLQLSEHSASSMSTLVLL